MEIVKPFLKYPGSKTRLSPMIRELLPRRKVLCDFFVGSGAIMLNTDYERYILSDINPHLIRLYKTLQTHEDLLIGRVDDLFTNFSNTDPDYYGARDRFNALDDASDPSGIERSALLVLLNKSAYNGLMRMNLSGKFNSPFGRYSKITAPVEGMSVFAQKAKRAEFHCRDFRSSFQAIKRLKNFSLYLDPPYALLNPTTFTSYAGNSFSIDDHKVLAKLARHYGKKVLGTAVLSNHDTEFTRELYREADLQFLTVQRSISCNGDNRGKAPELLAVYN